MKKGNKINPNNIELMVYDFDGVMTNNKVLIDQFGNESVIVNRADGLAISEIKKIGINQIIISTEKNAIVKKRAEKLGLSCLSGVENKKEVLQDYLYMNKIKKENTIYFGNDLNDLEAMRLVGYPVAPSDAHKDVKRVAKVITKAKGGDGVIRELLNVFKKR